MRSVATSAWRNGTSRSAPPWHSLTGACGRQSYTLLARSVDEFTFARQHLAEEVGREEILWIRGEFVGDLPEGPGPVEQLDNELVVRRLERVGPVVREAVDLVETDHRVRDVERGQRRRIGEDGHRSQIEAYGPAMGNDAVTVNP